MLPAPAPGPARADARLPHVIINERRNRQAAETYQVTAVPYPFKTREQYERTLQQPLGPDWNARGAFEAAVRPRVAVKRGAVIDPIEFKPAAGALASAAHNRNQASAKRPRRKEL